MMSVGLMTGLMSLWAARAPEEPGQAVENVDYAEFAASSLRCVIGNNKQ